MGTGDSFILKTWKLCMYASFLGCITLLFSLNHGQDSANLASLGITTTSPKLLSNVGSNSPMQTSPKLMSDGSNSTMQFPNPSNSIECTKEIDGGDKYCNMFEGRWVYDPEGSAPYNNSQCPFLSEQVSCQRNGRPDSKYEKWSWKANGCEIPR